MCVQVNAGLLTLKGKSGWWRGVGGLMVHVVVEIFPLANAIAMRAGFDIHCSYVEMGSKDFFAIVRTHSFQPLYEQTS